MNPLTNVKNITKLNETELARGLTNKSSSWHDQYKDSAWVFVGGLAYGLTEGDVLAVFSQYGEIVNINMVRHKDTGKIKGYCFICYENQKSTILAVDNLNGIKLCERTLRVDHVENYRIPKEHEDDDEIIKALHSEGCAPKARIVDDKSNDNNEPEIKRKHKKKKQKHKKKKSRKDSSDSSDESGKNLKVKMEVNVKQEKHDPGYNKYMLPSTSEIHNKETTSYSRSSNKDTAYHQERRDESHHKKQELQSSFRQRKKRSPSNESDSSDNRKTVKNHKHKRTKEKHSKVAEARKGVNMHHHQKKHHSSKDSKQAGEKHHKRKHMKSESDDFTSDSDEEVPRKRSSHVMSNVSCDAQRTRHDSTGSSESEKNNKSYHQDSTERKQSSRDLHKGSSSKAYERAYSDEERRKSKAVDKTHRKQSRPYDKR